MPSELMPLQISGTARTNPTYSCYHYQWVKHFGEEIIGTLRQSRGESPADLFEPVGGKRRGDRAASPLAPDVMRTPNRWGDYLVSGGTLRQNRKERINLSTCPYFPGHNMSRRNLGIQQLQLTARPRVPDADGAHSREGKEGGINRKDAN